MSAISRAQARAAQLARLRDEYQTAHIEQAILLRKAEMERRFASTPDPREVATRNARLELLEEIVPARAEAIAAFRRNSPGRVGAASDLR